jgi:hypothetical protein
MVLIVIRKSENPEDDALTKRNYRVFKDLFDVIGAERLTQSNIKKLVNKENAEMIMQRYGFYSMKL